MTQNPIITMEMENGGIIKAELYPETAPNTVNNFLSLVNKGFYNGLIFQFSQNGFENALLHTPGVLSMARAMHPDSAGSQFFIMHEEAPHLDGGYATFGKVVEGMDVVNKIAETPTTYGDRPLEPQVIKSMTAETFGTEYPEPETL